MTDSSTTLPHGGKQPVSNKLVIAVVSLAILTFLGILSETSLNIAYSTLMEEFSIGASVVQWLTTGYLLLLSVSIPSSPTAGIERSQIVRPQRIGWLYDGTDVPSQEKQGNYHA